ncbi:hypothetical protein ma201 [Moumouvirus australiensis]|uniref:PLOD1-3-like GT domain-containing protein n=1 Tax=Moumouvirus australiensis TaxID=2109587 RepID=A0A2P1EL42_9VIRU|nr:hypothetical protein QKC55_gp703 [Moumouvirus australiensis]AVL94587.1 hypothetical protein ma201 [Moumouvirus australiensis]
MEDILILGIGVSPNKNDGVLRFETYCKAFNLSYKIVGDGKIWNGGDMSAGAGGGQKVNELLQVLNEINENKLLIVCDTFDLFPVSGAEEIVNKYNNLCGVNKSIIFSSEVYCWPDKNLSNFYPHTESKYKYLNSGSFIGYRDDLKKLVSNILDRDDDQLYYTKKFLQGENIILDYNCQLFQAINGCKSDLIVHKNRVFNKYTKSYPIFIHGNGSSKTYLNYLENYIEPFTLIDIPKIVITEPQVFIALYVDTSMLNDFTQFFEGIKKIDYHNKKIHVYDKFQNDQIEQLIKLLGFNYKPNVVNYEFDDFINSNCDYYCLIEQNFIIKKPTFLKEIIPLCNNHHRIIAPLFVSKNNSCFTNFWGSLDEKGYYSRSEDYLSLITREKIGLWNVPYVSGLIIFDKSVILKWNLKQYENYKNDRDMNLCFNLRKHTLFMYSCNLDNYGFIN